jgi:hypothetical protein
MVQCGGTTPFPAAAVARRERCTARQFEAELHSAPAAMRGLSAGALAAETTLKYNLDLGDRRANAAKEFLVQLGVPADRLKPSTTAKGARLHRIERILLAKEPALAFLVGAIG